MRPLLRTLTAVENESRSSLSEPNVPKFDLWLLAPPSYGAASVLLFSLAHRAFSSFGHDLLLAQLLDPRHILFVHGGYALGVAIVALALSVWRRSQLAVLVTLAVLFAGAYLDALYFIGTPPRKVDIRLLYAVELAVQLAWLSALCSVAAGIISVPWHRRKAT